MIWLGLSAALFGPALVLLAMRHGPTLLRSFGQRLQRLGRRLPGRRPAPDPVPVDRFAADLHRLALHLAEVDGAEAPAKMARLKAASLAYDDVLIAACRALEIPAPDSSPLRPLERLETEAALAQAGLDW